jgi:tannase
MWFSWLLLFWILGLGVVAIPSLTDVCTTTYIQSALPANGFIEGIAVLSTSITANQVTNYSVTAGNMNPGKSGLDFCNITFSYAHDGRKDKVRTKNYVRSVVLC